MPADTPRRPTARAARMLLAVGLPFVLANVLTKQFLDDPALRDLRNLLKAVMLVGAYWVAVRWIERRPVSELSCRGAGRETLAGLLLGSLLFALTMAVLATLGVYRIDGHGDLAALSDVAAAMLPKIAAGALIEEVLFRLLGLRLLETSLGTWLALLVSSALFGAAHGSNVGATPGIAVMLGLEAGLLFGAAYLLTRRLWLCAALHLAWNFTQGAIFSVAVSGQQADGWLQGRLDGPVWLTGGAFGAEGSVIAFVLCLAAAALLLRWAVHRRPFVAPRWRTA